MTVSNDKNNINTPTQVKCDGQKTNSHPAVYLHADKNGVVVCPYCSKKFKLF